MKALILAGGKGTELLPLTFHVPKPLVSVGNIPFLFYQLEALKQAGIHEVIFSLSYLPRKIQDLLGDGSNFGMVIRYSIEPVPLGTAGAIHNALNMLDQTTLVLNGDVLSSIDLKAVLDHHINRGSAVTLVTGLSSQPQRYGFVQHDSRQVVTGFVEKPRDQGPVADHVNVGFYVFERSILERIPPNIYYTLERELFPRLIAEGVPVHVYRSHEYWHDIGDSADYLQANFDVLNGRVPLPRFYGLFEKQSVTLPPGAHVDERSFIDSSAILKAGVEVENSIIGKNCRLEEMVRVKDSVILPGTRIKRGAVLHYCVLGLHCVVGESVALRGAVFGDKTTISDCSKFA